MPICGYLNIIVNLRIIEISCNKNISSQIENRLTFLAKNIFFLK